MTRNLVEARAVCESFLIEDVALSWVGFYALIPEDAQLDVETMLRFCCPWKVGMFRCAGGV